MLVIVLESCPYRLRGYLTRLLLEIRAGVFIGDYSKKVRDNIWKVVQENVGDGNAVIAWSKPNDIGFDFDTCGFNRRIPCVLGDMKLCSFLPESTTGPSVAKKNVQ